MNRSSVHSFTQSFFGWWQDIHSLLFMMRHRQMLLCTARINPQVPHDVLGYSHAVELHFCLHPMQSSYRCPIWQGHIHIKEKRPRTNMKEALRMSSVISLIKQSLPGRSNLRTKNWTQSLFDTPIELSHSLTHPSSRSFILSLNSPVKDQDFWTFIHCFCWIILHSSFGVTYLAYSSVKMKIHLGCSLMILLQCLTMIVAAVPMTVTFDRLSPRANTTDRLVFCHFMVGALVEFDTGSS